MERLDIDGVSVRCAQSGPVDAPIVIMSNSLAADLTMWEPQAEKLQQDFHIVRFDARGHGQTSASPGDYTLELLVDDVLGLMNRLSIESAHFIGLSLGGMIGQLLAARAPERIASLILCATFAESPSNLWAERVRAVRRSGVGELVEGTLERWFTPTFRANQPAVIDRVRRMIASTSAEGYAGCAAAIRDMDFSGVPEAIGCPTLLIGADEDISASPAAMQALHKRISGSEYVQIDRAAHLFTLEQPEKAAALMAEFLARQSERAARVQGSR